jgi:hypothetical protein
MNKLDTSANDQQGFSVVNVWPPVLGSRTLSDYHAEAKRHRAQAFMAAIKYIFNGHSPDEMRYGVDDSRRLNSPKTIGLGGLRNAQF